ncbi:MAG: LLM class flavin-dependent oxidoreductase [Gammaproteobacteria bacterium]|nr:LLM class flavin-dependent oxidoreductase [Gammaproteobacteria bacterium]MCP4090769.1 LLM class flavin-dependent oxidoreductase [Gammaproteobacteria bacterium]MCP4277196.1 LLM class flavin-dependent oxidoreductase [Gammaproteobacteria bacterium]MCP4832818.1 LLM class flavin-dependent oxidoreductase [Gammaproteobacteria bacterium]MCP4927994.1 LLM class flavin-dependent oxidoreductase [Gammaproteobacteria bacterium]
MKFDVILDPDSSPQEVCELGLLAESYGLNAVWTSNYPSSRDPFINLCPLALASSKIRLGPLVITPYEMHPYKISKALDSLNELCGGRANILTGGPTGVNAAMGMDFSRMVGRTRECVEILKGANPDEPLNYKGDIFQVWGYQPKWATDKPPKIYIGANKEQMTDMATDMVDNIMLGDTTEERLGSSLQLIKEKLESHGRSREDVSVSCLVAWHVKEDKEKSSSEAKRHLALRGMLDLWFLSTFLNEEECQIVDENRANIFKAYKQKTDVIEGVPAGIVDKLVDNLSMSGDHADVDKHIETLRRYRDIGLDEVAFKLHEDQAAAIKIIGERVLPAFQA